MALVTGLTEQQAVEILGLLDLPLRFEVLEADQGLQYTSAYGNSWAILKNSRATTTKPVGTQIIRSPGA